MKKLLSGILVASLATMALVGCSEKPSEKSETFVSLDINPALELVVDENNVVIDAYGTNTDAKVLLHGEDGIKGMKIDAAIEKIADLSIELGYINGENKVVEYTMSSTLDSNKLGKLEANINASFDKAAGKANLEIKLDSNGTFTLERQLEHLKAKYPDNADIQALTPSDYKLILAAMAADYTLELEDAVKMKSVELIDYVQENRDKYYNYAVKAYNDVMAGADVAYTKAKGAFTRGVYTTYYASHMKTNPVNYGLIYSAYGTTADCLDGVLELAYLSESYSKKILEDEDVQKLVAKMKEIGIKLDDKLDCLKDENGNYTIDSVNAYINKAIKNMDDKELGAALDDLIVSLNSLEDSIGALIDSIVSEHKDELEAVANAANAVATSLKTLVSTVIKDEKLKEIINTYAKELDTLATTVTALVTEKSTLEDVKAYSNDLRAKEAELLTQIEKDIPAEDLAKLNDSLAKLDSTMLEAKKVFEASMERAFNEADKYLANLKTELLK